MEINLEQVKRIIIKETLEECIKEINKKIEQEKSAGCKVSQFYTNGLTRAKDIIEEIKRERYL